MIQAVIFDLDGVLIDSEPIWREAEIEVFATVGIDLDDATCRETMGMRIDEVVDLRFAQKPWTGPTPGAIRDQIMDRVVDLISNSGQGMPGVVEAIELFERRGTRIALASSSSYRLIHAALRRLGLASRFELVHSADDEEHCKPHPAVYLGAAHRLGVEPSACLAIEDSIAGIASAKAAGMKCIAVPDAELRGDPLLNEADCELGSLIELNEKLLEKLA